MAELIEDVNDQIAKRLSNEEAGEIADQEAGLTPASGERGNRGIKTTPTALSGTIPVEKLAEITSKATEIAIEQSGLQGMFKPMQEWEKEKYASNTKDLQQIITNGPPSANSLETIKKNRANSKAPQTGKTLTADEVLLKLEAQTQAVKWVQGIANPDIPKMSHVKVRELLISMQNQIDRIKSETLANIQAV